MFNGYKIVEQSSGDGPFDAFRASRAGTARLYSPFFETARSISLGFTPGAGLKSNTRLLFTARLLRLSMNNSR